jgi:hypothetical protein
MLAFESVVAPSKETGRPDRALSFLMNLFSSTLVAEIPA